MVGANIGKSLSADFYGSAVAPYNRGAEELFIFIDDDEPVHLVRNADSDNAVFFNAEAMQELPM